MFFRWRSLFDVIVLFKYFKFYMLNSYLNNIFKSEINFISWTLPKLMPIVVLKRSASGRESIHLLISLPYSLMIKRCRKFRSIFGIFSNHVVGFRQLFVVQEFWEQQILFHLFLFHIAWIIVINLQFCEIKSVISSFKSPIVLS